MADLSHYVPFLLKWEGGYSDHPADRGGATQQGVTLKTWQQVGYDKNKDGCIDEADLRLIDTRDLVEGVLRPHFWNRWQADRIRTQAIAELLVDWLWMSGPYTIRLAQKELKVDMDGMVGNRTLEAINTDSNQYDLFYRLKVARYAHLYRIVGYRPATRVFLEGWLNRVRDLKFRLSIVIALLSVAMVACRPAQPLIHQTDTLTHSQLDSRMEGQERHSTDTQLDSRMEGQERHSTDTQLDSRVEGRASHRRSEYFELETSISWFPLLHQKVALAADSSFRAALMANDNAWLTVPTAPCTLVADSLPGLVYAYSIRQKASRGHLQASDTTLQSNRHEAASATASLLSNQQAASTTASLLSNQQATSATATSTQSQAKASTLSSRRQARTEASEQQSRNRSRGLTGWLLAVAMLAVLAVAYHWRRHQ